MKSLYEIHFEKQNILSILERGCCPRKRVELMHEFYKHGSTYYEELCEMLYFLAIGEAPGYLYITPAGRPYLSYKERNREDRLLFRCDELPAFQGDLHEQLDFFLQQFSGSKFFCNFGNSMVDIGNTM